MHREVASRTRFEFRDLGEQEVKNIPDPVHAYAVEVPEAPVAVVPARRLAWRIAGGIVISLGVIAAGWWLVERDGPPPIPKPPT